jgi:hypothetical protein
LTVDGAWDVYRIRVKAAAIAAKRMIPITTVRPGFFFSVRSIKVAGKVSFP